jgi:hypothetical protein
VVGGGRDLISGTVLAFAWRDRGKTTITPYKDNSSPVLNLNSGPHEYEAGVLTTRLGRSAGPRSEA